MLYLIIFIISISAILTLCFISKDSNNILHCIKESCNIDSVRFEKRLRSLSYFTKKSIRLIFYYIGKLYLAYLKCRRKILKKTKEIVRKKLFVSKRKEHISEYISEMKK